MTSGQDPRSKNAIAGRVLTAFGVMLFTVGLGFCIGLVLGVVTRLRYCGVAAMIVGNIIGWIGQSLTAGKLKSNIKTILKSEVTDTLRLRTSLNTQAAVLVAIGFALVVVAVVLVWSVATKSVG